MGNKEDQMRQRIIGNITVLLARLAIDSKVFVIQDGCCGIDLHEGDIDKALQMLNEKGAQIVSSDTLE